MKKLKVDAEVLASLALTVLGIIIIILSLNYGIWAANKPAKGFMPFLSSLLMTSCSLIWLFQTSKAQWSIKNSSATEDEESVKEETESTFSSNDGKWILIVSLPCLLVVILMQWIGIYISLFMFLLAWMKLINHFSWLKTIVASLSIIITLYVIFSLGLKIPFPRVAGL